MARLRASGSVTSWPPHARRIGFPSNRSLRTWQPMNPEIAPSGSSHTSDGISGSAHGWSSSVRPKWAARPGGAARDPERATSS
jgi:hypothetical protein